MTTDLEKERLKSKDLTGQLQKTTEDLQKKNQEQQLVNQQLADKENKLKSEQMELEKQKKETQKLQDELFAKNEQRLKRMSEQIPEDVEKLEKDVIVLREEKSRAIKSLKELTDAKNFQDIELNELKRQKVSGDRQAKERIETLEKLVAEFKKDVQRLKTNNDKLEDELYSLKKKIQESTSNSNLPRASATDTLKYSADSKVVATSEIRPLLEKGDDKAGVSSTKQANISSSPVQLQKGTPSQAKNEGYGLKASFEPAEIKKLTMPSPQIVKDEEHGNSWLEDSENSEERDRKALFESYVPPKSTVPPNDDTIFRSWRSYR